MADKVADIDINRLGMAAQRARLAMRRRREVRVDMTRQLATPYYSEEGARLDVPVNLLSVWTSIIGRKLIANNPRALLTTDVASAKPVVSAMMSWLNDQIVKINLVETLQRSAFDSLYGLGIIKVAIADPAQAANVGWNIKAGEPYAENIDLDDFVYDVHAARFDQASFIGHRFRVPLRAAKSMYGKAGKGLVASQDQIYNLEGDERIKLLARTTLAGDEEFEDMVDLWEFFLPRERLIVTMLDDDLTGPGSSDTAAPKGKALRIQKWIGPACGPYHFLGMMDLPGNAMPKPPAYDLYPLHMAVNRMARKLINQADRQKEVIFVRGNADTDGGRLLKTNDGEATRIDEPESLKAVMWGGPNQQNFQLFGAFKELFSWLAGNLDLQGGLGPQSRTAKQDEMLESSSSATVTDMQQRAVKQAESVTRALCWFYYHHPKAVLQSTYRMQGLPDVTAIQRIHPRGQNQRQDGRPQISRDASFSAMKIHIDPYSMQYQSPQQRLAALNQVVTQIIVPMAQLLQQSGSDFDVMAYLDQVSTLGDIPQLKEIMKSIQPPQVEGGIAGQGGPIAAQVGKPAETTRNYVRRSESGATNKGTQMEFGNRMQPQNGQQNGATIK